MYIQTVCIQTKCSLIIAAVVDKDRRVSKERKKDYAKFYGKRWVSMVRGGR